MFIYSHEFPLSPHVGHHWPEMLLGREREREGERERARETHDEGCCTDDSSPDVSLLPPCCLMLFQAWSEYWPLLWLFGVDCVVQDALPQWLGEGLPLFGVPVQHFKPPALPFEGSSMGTKGGLHRTGGTWSCKIFSTWAASEWPFQESHDQGIGASGQCGAWGAEWESKDWPKGVLGEGKAIQAKGEANLEHGHDHGPPVAVPRACFVAQGYAPWQCKAGGGQPPPTSPALAYAVCWIQCSADPITAEQWLWVGRNLRSLPGWMWNDENHEKRCSPNYPKLNPCSRDCKDEV